MVKRKQFSKKFKTETVRLVRKRGVSVDQAAMSYQLVMIRVTMYKFRALRWVNATWSILNAISFSAISLAASHTFMD